ASEWKRLRPDVHFWLEDGDRQLRARCSVWKEELPALDGTRPAGIGHFEAVDVDSGCMVMETACQWLQKQGKELVAGPIDANTWNKYKLTTFSQGRPPFLMEWVHPGFYVDIWRKAGFSPLAEYHSAEMKPQVELGGKLEQAADRLAE